MGWIGFYNGKEALKNLSFNQLTSIRATKSSQMQSYLDLVEAQIVTLGENPTTVTAMKELSRAFIQLGTQADQSKLVNALVARDGSLSA